MVQPLERNPKTNYEQFYQLLTNTSESDERLPAQVVSLTSSSVEWGKLGILEHVMVDVTF